jgi:hypothetical protein
MNLASPSALSYAKSLNFSFSNTKRNEPVNINRYSSASYVIDVNGNIYQGSGGGESISVVIIGGDDTFVNEKVNRVASTFYVTEAQKQTLYKIMKELSERSDEATISSDNDKLEQSLSALYRNYCG